jgi:hypothetical protein
MLGYISTLNRNRRTDEPDHSTVHRAAELAARECCRTTYCAGSASKNTVYSEFVARGGLKEELLDYLEMRLQLVRTIPPAHSHIEFSFDPIADYLAGLWLLQSLKTDQQWLEFLEAVDHQTDQKESVVDFLAAVLECCIRKNTEFKGSAWILERLSERIRHKATRSSPQPPSATSATA